MTARAKRIHRQHVPFPAPPFRGRFVVTTATARPRVCPNTSPRAWPACCGMGETMAKDLPDIYRPIIVTRVTRAETDEQLLSSWVEGLQSDHSRRNFERTTREFLVGLPTG